MARLHMRTVRRGVVALVLVAGCAPAAYATTQYVRQHLHDRETIAGAPAAPALNAVTGRPVVRRPPLAPVPTPHGVAMALAVPLADETLGPKIRVEVQDALTGKVLYGRNASSPGTPASTAKLFTAVAALAVLSPTYRMTTSIVRGSVAGSIVIVGGGDPTLTSATGAVAPAYAGAARLQDLAIQLAAHKLPVNRIVVDDSLFRGPSISPDWAPDDVPSDYASAITALMTDGGRAAPGDVVRSAQPDLDAASDLADALDIPDAQIVQGKAPAHATPLAVVHSATVATLVKEMLQSSDNVLAECLARQVAIAEGQPASFAGSVRAVRMVLRTLGIDIGTGLVDGSGLSAHDKVTAHAIAAALTLASTEPRLTPLLADLPVAAWSGTLAARYRGPIGHYAAGLVRAKTGTLSNVSTLAGVVHDHDGRLLVFVLMADAVPGDLTTYAEDAWDVTVTRLAQCGCH